MRGRRRGLQLALLALPPGVLVVGAWSRRWMSDDGFINLRIVEMIKAGHGPVFNAGERVEAGTSTLWVWLLAAADLVAPARLEWVAVVLGITLSAAGVAFAIAASRLLVGADAADREWLVPVGAAIVVAVAPMWTFASSGLENGLTYCWIGACAWLLARWARGPGFLPLPAAAAVGLGPLVRPELALVTGLLLLAVLVAQRGHGWRRAAATVGSAAAVPVAYQLFRMGYYAELVPSPALAKEVAGARWDEGWSYLREFAAPYGLWLPLALLALGAYLPLVRRLRREGDRSARSLLVVAALGTGGLVHGLYIVRVGGDFMFGRLLLPSLFMLAAPVAVLPLRREHALGLAVVGWAVVCAAALRTPADNLGEFATGRHNLVTVSDLEWGPGQPARGWYTGPGAYAGLVRVGDVPPGATRPVVASYGVGIGSYALGPDIDLLDLLGLGDAFTAHLRLDRRGIIGHEKPLPTPWMAARLTAPGTTPVESQFPLPGLGVAPIDDPRGRPFAERVESARRALECDPLVRFLADRRRPLTPGRFLRNLGRSVSNSRFRIPPEPGDAVARFCR